MSQTIVGPSLRTENLSVGYRILESIAAEKGVSPYDLDQPLFDAIDPDALDTLVESMSEGDVTFEYAGYSITVDCHGAIQLTSLQSAG